MIDDCGLNIARDRGPRINDTIYFFRAVAKKKKKNIIKTIHRPLVRREHPPNLSISIGGGKETNRDLASNCE
jgi:hypothetical protein